MGLRDRWNGLETGGKILVGLGVSAGLLIVVVPLLVILAAVVGSFVLGFGGGSEAAATPQVAFEFDADASAETVTITHDGGDSIDASQLLVEVGDQETVWDATDGEVSPGDTTTVAAQSGQTIRLIWNGQERTVLAAYDVS